MSIFANNYASEKNMINFIKGKIVELNPTYVVVETGGIGFLINISLNTYSQLNGKEEATVYIYESIREDAYQLYGFTTKQEKDLFLLLISVSGVGAGTARMVFSSLSPSDIENIIASGNSTALKAVKGIGGKTAERIIIDLKDKVKIKEGFSQGKVLSNNEEIISEAVSALTMLGFNQMASNRTVRRIASKNPELSVEEIIKSALKSL